MTHPAIIYKITPREDWKTAKDKGVFTGAPIDLSDGYIHFSTAEQVVETAAKHFAGQADLLLIAVDATALDPDLKWETSRGGALFPHLYADLPMSAVIWEREAPLGDDGLPALPDLET